MGFAIYGEEIGDISGNPEFDTARAIWGKEWRLPTQELNLMVQQVQQAYGQPAYLGSEDIKPTNFSESFHIRISRLCHIDSLRAPIF